MFPRRILARTASGRVAPNLGIPIEHSRDNRSTVRKASRLGGCFLVRGFDDRVFLFVHIATVADGAVELAGHFGSDPELESCFALAL